MTVNRDLRTADTVGIDSEDVMCPTGVSDGEEADSGDMDSVFCLFDVTGLSRFVLC
jgi:hypothetical protein